MKFFDTHAHLDMEPFRDELEAVLQRALDASVQGTCVIGCTPDSSRDCCELARRFPAQLCAAVGIQPNYVSEARDDWMDAIRELAGQSEVVAIGETGLDCYWDDSPIEVQKEFFEQHIELAEETGKPLVIHMRESGELIYEQLKPHAARKSIRGIMHSFTGDWDLAAKFIDLGLHISFAGMVTFKKSQNLRDVASRVPVDRLLIETDSPYLSPEPLRGKRPNEPARVVHTAQVLADARSESLASLAETTWENASRLFAWSPA